MATYEANVRRAFSSQDTLFERDEHCAADPEQLAAIGRARGHQVRVRRKDGDDVALYTVSEVREEAPDSVIRMARKARARLTPEARRAAMGKGLYLGKQAEAAGPALGAAVELNPADLLTHGVLVGMTGSGKTGLAVVMPFFLLMMARSARLLLDPGHELFGVCGGVACALILALLVAGLGSQTFYPREGAVGMWCAIGLMMRVWVERRQRAAVTAGSMAARFQIGFAGAAAPAIPRRGETPLDPLRS